MQSINKNELISLTSDILSDSNLLSIIQENEPIDIKLFCMDENTIELAGKSLEYFNKVIELISEDLSFECVSLKTIEDKYASLIISLIYETNLSRELIKRKVNLYLSELKDSIEEQRVIAYIDCLKLVDINEVKIGNVRLVPFSLIEQKLRDDVRRTIELNSYYDAHQKEISRKHVEKRIDHFSEKVCAEITLWSDSKAAYDKAFSEIDYVINLLRCYSIILFSNNLNVKIGLSEAVVKRNRYSIAFRANGSFHDHFESVGPVSDYILTNNDLEHLKQNCNLSGLSNVLSKSMNARSDMELRLTAAIRWIGMGVHDDVNCDKFLKHAIALEALFTNQDDEISTPLSERCAFVLSDKSDKREQIYRLMKKLYRIRSKIAHQGLIDVQEDDVRKIQSIAVMCLLKFCNNIDKWDTLEDLDKWILQKKFS